LSCAFKTTKTTCSFSGVQEILEVGNNTEYFLKFDNTTQIEEGNFTVPNNDSQENGGGNSTAKLYV